MLESLTEFYDSIHSSLAGGKLILKHHFSLYQDFIVFPQFLQKILGELIDDFITHQSVVGS